MHTCTINCTYISSKIGKKLYFPMAGNILSKVNVSSASLSEPVQAGAEQRSFCPTVFSPWTWGWQGCAHTQLRRRQCSLGGPAVWSPEAGLCPGTECPGQPSCTQAWCLLRITASEEAVCFLLPESALAAITPVFSHCPETWATEKAFLPHLSHASSQHLNKCKGYISGVTWDHTLRETGPWVLQVRFRRSIWGAGRKDEGGLR